MMFSQEKSSNMMYVISTESITWLLDLVRLMLYPSFLLLDQLISFHTPTAEDTKNGGIPLTTKLIFTPLFSALLVITLPLVLVFYPIRCLLLLARDPFALSVKHTAYTNTKALNTVRETENRFTIATGNLCLMPEFLCRFNHLKDVKTRSRKIGERFVIDQFFAQENDTKHKANNSSVNDTDTNAHTPDGKHDEKIRTKFSSLDFILIQEAWSTCYYKSLMQELHKVYPYVVHDAGVHSFSVNKFAMNSGLMIASRYPVAAVDFKPFVNFCKHGALFSSGLLMVQVNLGPSKDGGRRVGYLCNTHLQSYQDDEIVIPKQMDEILEFTKDFVNHTKGPKDNVLFNFLCGDFNSDNISPGDVDCQNHKLFDIFEDFAREGPGKDKDWTVGTELRQRFMLEPMMSTPESMKMALLDPCHRRRYMIDADVVKHNLESLVGKDPPYDELGNVVESPEGGRRRIDCVVFHKAQPVKVENFNFVTRLATLTDHIPVQMEFTCLGQNQK